MITDYFKDLFQSSHPSDEDIEAVIGGMEARVSDDMNETLIQPFSAEEVRHAISQMYPYILPCPDGMLPFFYQKYWHIVRPEVTSFVLEFLNHQVSDAKINYNYVVLIPKCPKPETMSHFRPISLCTITYKIASKVLANRMKPLLSSIIFESQFAFVPGRLITNNVLVAYEMNHYLAHKYEMLFGQLFGHSHPERGLRQGDLLSPYLFLFCVEALSLLISLAEANGDIRGVAVSRHGPRVSNLLFADDTLIFAKPRVGGPSQVSGSIHPSFHHELSSSACHEIDSLMSDFVWHKKGVRKIHWLAWDKVCFSKEVGGLGLRKMSDVNLAMLAKQLWRVVINPDNLIGHILKQRYFPHCELHEARAVAGCSFTWSSILVSRELIAATVVELIDGSGNWNVGLIHRIFWQEDVDAILAIPFNMGDQDVLRWHFEKHSHYSVHSGYKTRAVSGGFCPWCGFEVEDILQTLFRCHFACLVWALFHIPWRYIMVDHDDTETLIREIHRSLDSANFGRTLLIYWFLWWTHKKLIFQSVEVSAEEVIGRVWSMEASFLLFQKNARELEKTRQAHHGILLSALDG
ncbi:UNVERIFIED_CONTAM: putative mitochondrial protein [Sesamum angustifolium]|uniref:Mitochondrial protein n=1 Tax=Sesamum angustifolium TaxID=2727405 RepID=A0AAW2IS69_9LAMI